jgi:hypothetical protein
VDAFVEVGKKANIVDPTFACSTPTLYTDLDKIIGPPGILLYCITLAVKFS